MARRSSIALAAGITTILSITTGTDAWGFHHNHAKVAALHVRQDAGASVSIPPVSYDLPGTANQLPSGSAIPTIGVSSLYNDSMPAFATSTIQEPIATVCPGQPADSGVFTILADPTRTVSATAVLPNGSKTTFATTSGPASASGTVNPGNARIAVDGNGCQTLFAPRVTAICSTTVSPVGIPEVIVSDCEQWVTFSSDTKICPTAVPTTYSASLPILSITTRNTILETIPSAQPNVAAPPVQPVEGSSPSQPVGQPPAPEPEQPAPSVVASISAVVEPSVDEPAPAITSANVLASNSVATDPDPTPSDMPTLVVSVIPVPEDASTDSNTPAAVETELPNTTNNTDASRLKRRQAPPSITPAILPLPTTPPNGDFTAPGTYYAAHWYDVARGGVPPRVRAIECEVGAGKGAECVTYQERWTATSFLRTLTETRPVSYSGAVVITDGAHTYTTTISIATFTTTTRVTYAPTVIKQRLLSDNPPVVTTAVPAAAAAASAGVFAGKQAPGSEDDDDEGPVSTTTITGTITVTNTVYEGVATSVVGAGSGGAGGAGTRTIELLSKSAS